ncbi:MAG TPA: cohesin domain-containing protein [Candidatus Angelobacter sp.]|nr:cohesin domain-containing protein [Candidatus Angelobacter sp.]
MRRVATVLPFVLLCSALLTAGDSAKSLFKQGVQAETRQDYEAAYDYYRQAYQLKPSELKYRVPFERLRFQAAASKVHRAQRLRDDGKLQEALALFQQAASIDPSNDLAGQEIRRTQQMILKQQGPAPAPPRSEDDSLRKRLDDATGPVRLNSVPNTPLPALEMTNDSKVEYETICKLANLNVLFDPDYTPRRLSISLRNVTLQEALDILALDSRTFWRPVTPNTIFVAADTQAKRRELEQNVIKTFYLGNVSTATDLQDIVNAIRTVLEVQRIQQIPSQNAIVIKGTPDQLALAQKMVDDIDKSRPEVVVDVIVAQVRRDKVRSLGILPPQNASVALQPPNAVAVASPSPGGTTTSIGLNFNNIQHLNSTSYALTISPVQAEALFNDTDAKILQSPRIRATNGEKATLKVADRIPIATGSFGTPTGIGTAIGAVGVNTQFTYTDVGVIMDITPTVHPDGQVTLKTSLEISNLNGSESIGGVTQPIISQRKEESVMRLKDGEINMLGGIYENQVTTTTSGTPFLGSIPILKYIFSQETKQVTTNEIVFLLIPHVVRGQELSDMNRRAFDVGTGTSIDLHMAARSPESAAPVPAAAPAPAPTVSPQPPAAAPGTPPGAAAMPPASGNPAAPDSGGAPGQISLRLDPGTLAQPQGSVFALNVVMAHGQDVSAVRTEIAYDPKVMQLMSVTDGGFLGRDGRPAPLQQRSDPANGRVVISAVRPPGSPGISGDGTVFNLTFLAKAKGSSTVSIAVSEAGNSQKQPLQVQGSQASVTIN